MPTTVTVTRDTAGRYFVSLLVEEEIAALPPVAAQVGIDLGLYDVVVLSTGERVGNPKFFHRDARRLARAQRRLAKKQRGSRNREKARRRVARVQVRIADRRMDFLHKLSTRIIRENQAVCVKSLNVKAMVRHPTLAKAISAVGWGELVRQLPYKAAWYGRTLVAIDKWYPCSKYCCECGHVLGSLGRRASVDISRMRYCARSRRQRRAKCIGRGAHGRSLWRGRKTGTSSLVSGSPR
jgi:putative transposase